MDATQIAVAVETMPRPKAKLDPLLDLADYLPLFRKLARNAKGWKDVDADDLVQEAMLAVIQKTRRKPLLRNAVDVGLLRWLARRTVGEAWARWKPWAQLDEGAEAGAFDPFGSIPDEGEEAEERRWLAAEEIGRLLPLLPARRRAILAFRFGLADGVEHSLEETGRQFGISKQRAGQQVQAALAHLRKVASLAHDN